MDMATAAHTVTGTTCGHRGSAVQEEAGEAAGGAAVPAGPATGLPAGNGHGPVATATIAAAVRKTGYEVVDRP